MTSIQIQSIIAVSSDYGHIDYTLGDTKVQIKLTPAEASQVFALAETFVRNRQAALADSLRTAPVGNQLTHIPDADYDEVTF